MQLLSLPPALTIQTQSVRILRFEIELEHHWYQVARDQIVILFIINVICMSSMMKAHVMQPCQK